MRYAINEQIYFDMAVETERQRRLACFRWFKKLLTDRKVRIDTMRSHVAAVRDLCLYKRCGRARP